MTQSYMLRLRLVMNLVSRCEKYKGCKWTSGSGRGLIDVPDFVSSSEGGRSEGRFREGKVYKGGTTVLLERFCF